MAKLETDFKRRKKRADIQKLVLTTVAVTGIVGVGLIAPGVLGALGKLGLKPKGRQLDIIRTSRNRLVERGFLIWEGNRLRLTPKGQQKLRVFELQDYKIAKPKRWDKRWRALIFDIPERRKGLRDKVRRTLLAVGFVRLQDSVWVYPYPCEDLVTLLKADFKIGKDMLYMIVDTLEHDQYMRQQFDLE